jgi:membrane protease YdiL (CAAX protease family)
MSTASSDPEQRPPLPAAAWNPWGGIAFVIVVFYAAQVVASLFILAYATIAHWSHSYAVSQLNNSVSVQFAYILAAETLSIGGIYLFLRVYKLNLASIGFKRPRWTDPFFGLAALPVYFILYIVALAVITHFVPSLNVSQKQQLGFNSVHGPLQMVLTFISLVVLPPLAEEIMVRGFLYSSLKKLMPTAGAVIITSAIFASAHLPEGGSAGPLYIAAIDTFTLSLVLIWLREKTGSLWAGITLHALKNGIAFMALFVFATR